MPSYDSIGRFSPARNLAEGRSMTYDNRDEGEIRRRAAWLLAMLAVVAALIVVVMVFFLGGSKSTQNSADPNPNYGTDPSTSSSTPAQTSSGASHGESTSTSPSAGSSTGATSSGTVPTASCPSSATCTVTGDIAGTMTAINTLRAQHNLTPIQASTTGVANTCALSSGSTCPQAYVWVHVSNLSGAAVVSAVQGFGGKDDLLDASAKQFAIGWAYDPGTHSSSCAVILVS